MFVSLSMVGGSISKDFGAGKFSDKNNVQSIIILEEENSLKEIGTKPSMYHRNPSVFTQRFVSSPRVSPSDFVGIAFSFLPRVGFIFIYRKFAKESETSLLS